MNAIRAHTPEGAQGALVASIATARCGRWSAAPTMSINYNRAVAVRQPGSSWKLFVYLPRSKTASARRSGVDEPVDISGWRPRNSSGRFAGEMDIRSAFAYSVNTVAAQLGQQVGTHSVANMAQRFGISTPINTHPSMVLGTSDVRVIDMARAFASVSARGVAVEPYGIIRVTAEDVQTQEERELFRAEPDQSRVLVAPYVAAEMTDLLQTAVATGTGRAAQIGRPVAGKTGTTSSNKDGWFIGFSSGITTAVWMGRDDARAVPGLAGGRAPARAFSDFMRYAVSSRPVEEFDTEVTLPEWQLEGDEDAYFGDPLGDEIFVDENGFPIERPSGLGEPPRYDDVRAPEGAEEDWLDEVLRRSERDRSREGSGAPEDDREDRPDQPAMRPQEEEPIR